MVQATSIIGTPIINKVIAILPPDIIEERNRIALYQAKNKTCPYCEMSKNEATGPRLVWQDKNFIAFCPFASQYPYEAWIMS